MFNMKMDIPLFTVFKKVHRIYRNKQNFTLHSDFDKYSHFPSFRLNALFHHLNMKITVNRKTNSIITLKAIADHKNDHLLYKWQVL